MDQPGRAPTGANFVALRQAAGRTDRTQSANRRGGVSGREVGAVLPGGSGTATPDQPFDLNRIAVLATSHAGFALLRYLLVPETAAQCPLLRRLCRAARQDARRSPPHSEPSADAG